MDKLPPRCSFLQLFRNLPFDLVPLLSEWVSTQSSVYPNCRCQNLWRNHEQMFIHPKQPEGGGGGGGRRGVGGNKNLSSVFKTTQEKILTPVSEICACARNYSPFPSSSSNSLTCNSLSLNLIKVLRALRSSFFLLSVASSLLLSVKNEYRWRGRALQKTNKHWVKNKTTETIFRQIYHNHKFMRITV